jgi:hypothetical protein
MKAEVRKLINRALTQQLAGNVNPAFVSLCDAICALSDDGRVLVAADPEKPLTLADLERQVGESRHWSDVQLNGLLNESDRWVIGDFEIRRRK